MKTLRLNNLSVGYKHALIENINLSLAEGQFITLIGSNGSGKSTLIKTLLNIIKPLQGQVFYGDMPMNQYSAAEWSTIFSAVFSGLPFIPMIRIRELICIGAKEQDKAWETYIIKALEISHLLEKYANEVSDGQLQKVMIARALMQNTPYVIFDEPTAHLDFRNKKEVFFLLKKLVLTTKKTFIIVSHEVLQALALADEVWYLEQKQLYKGTPDEIEEKFGLKEEILKLNQYVKN